MQQRNNGSQFSTFKHRRAFLFAGVFALILLLTLWNNLPYGRMNWVAIGQPYEPLNTPTSTATATATVTLTATPTVTATATVPPDTCQITGIVDLQGRDDDSGAAILVNGTPKATTTSDGAFTLSDVASGTYTVTAAHTSYLSSEHESVVCQANQVTELPKTKLLGGDVNGDRAIDLLDLVIVGAAYDTRLEDPAFDSRADINGSEHIEILDLVAVATNFRRTGPTDWPTTPTPAVFTVGDYLEHPSALRQLSARNLSEAESWELHVTNMHDMYGIDVTLTFDPAAIQVVDAEPGRAGLQIMPGPLFTDHQSFFVAENRVTVDEEAEVGTVTFVATLLRPAQPINGRGVVATIRFEPVGTLAAPETAFTIRNARLANHHGHPMTVEWEGNTIRQVFRIHLPLIVR